MTETWLRANRRLLIAACCLGLVAGLCGAMLLAGLTALFSPPAARWVLIGVIALSWLGFAIGIWISRRPRLAYSAGELLVFMRRGSPIRLPIELVECFLLGRGPSFLPGQRHAETETTTLVVRLRPQAEEWSHVDVEPRLGSWCDSHIIIRGTWCERIDVPLANQLNARLAAAQKAIAARSAIKEQA